jgi:hypothetical protein
MALKSVVFPVNSSPIRPTCTDTPFRSAHRALELERSIAVVDGEASDADW